MIRTGLVAAVLVAAAFSEAKANSFQCAMGESSDPDVRAEVKAIAHNRAMEAIVREYRERWDAAYMRAQCEAFSAGIPHYIGCLKEKRDWSAIKKAIPLEYFKMDQRTLHPVSQEERARPNGLREARQFCFDVGALTR